MAQLNEQFRRMQVLAGIITEAEANSPSPFLINIYSGEFTDDEEKETKFVQILSFDEEEEDWLDVDNYPNLAYLNDFGAGIWTMEPLEQYDGNDDYEIGDGSIEFEFNTADEVENFMKNELKAKLQSF
jgi:hypothetical protein